MDGALTHGAIANSVSQSSTLEMAKQGELPRILVIPYSGNCEQYCLSNFK
jgi:hypothetical protein